MSEGADAGTTSGDIAMVSQQSREYHIKIKAASRRAKMLISQGKAWLAKGGNKLANDRFEKALSVANECNDAKLILDTTEMIGSLILLYGGKRLEGRKYYKLALAANDRLHAETAKRLKKQLGKG
jgi:hypothetical protein